MKNIGIVLILLLGYLTIQAQPSQIDYRSIPTGVTIDNNQLIYNALKDTPHVYIFYAPECPLSQKYTLTIASLFTKFGNKVKFIGVFPGSEESIGQFQEFKTKYKINYPLIKDEKLELISALKATVTPEAFLIDSYGKIVYHGAIDDWAIKLGKTKQQATVNYLENAIEGLLNNTAVETRYVKPIGCYIEQ
ncbi:MULTISPECIES: redoxin domain-containing protein [Sphingobacterium]|uniref:Redoxin domain-containing protein n=1 Tax=Sphingobacterium kitahiroshimense TaxID=470446 RepID=A0ABV0BUK5_9SPHI|nr:redoxin domain-containing protein [Sphingobacterium sp. JUb56]MBB2949901.1 peroxiredoxin [Sphingobacterium sp. JUb56]